MAAPPGDDIFDAAPLITGELADIFVGDYGPNRALFKVARDDTEALLMNEAVVLSDLRDGADPKFVPYLPTLMNSFTHAGRMVNAFEPLTDFHPLTKVREVYPDGIDPRDMAWMLRRMLVVLGFTHRDGYVHGAVHPKHVMINPEEHGLVLVDWCYAVKDGEPLERIDHEFNRWYPPEASSDPVSSTLDIYMAAKTAIWLCGGDPWTDMLPDGTPREYRAFFAGCTRLVQSERPVDAWEVLRHFDELLERLYGPRKFRPFTLATS